MKKLIVLLSFILVSMSIAQTNDGALKYNFGGPISGFFLPGIGQCGRLAECEVTFNVIAGKFWNGRLQGPEYEGSGWWMSDVYGWSELPENGTGRHNVHFETGPLVSGNYSEGAVFGAGGDFHLVSGSAPYLACTADLECTFNAHWIWSRLRRTDLSNGAHTYEFDGELIGAYSDSKVGDLRKIRAHYHQVSGEWNNLLAPPESQQSWTGGSLDVFLSGPQG